MFNKAMSILRRLINELLVQEYIDEDGVIQPFIDENTEIIIEVARELNDNNRRIAIERYQNERRNKREKIRQFINEFKEKNKNYSTINTEEKIPLFEMWEEQTFDEALDEKGQKVKNRNTEEIRKENKAIKRYELWLEQKGQCMYTGRMIGISQLFSLDIQEEHTIPRSLLPDNTMTNLSVCYSNYNNDVKNSRIPRECPNYNRNMDISEIGSCTAIEPRLKKWQELRDHYKSLFEINSKPIGNEDENKKNKRIQNKHYYKMHFDYWRDKINRFTADEIKESWVRRQLTDTQMVSKYAREFLKTYFKKVLVQKGSTTADFRKIFGIQGEETKDRSKHTHHCIDAAVLTLIPTNSSKRMQMLKQLYKEEENKGSITRKKPDGLHDFNPQTLIDNIEKETLIVNYQKDKITEPTYRNVRKRGKFQYLKNNAGKYIKDENGEKILLKAKGASVRGDLFQQTFIGKIRSVERDENGKPLRNEKGNWKYKTGSNEFVYVERKPISEVKTEDIIDPDIKRLVKEQRQNGVDDHKIKDHQGKYIRHIRVKTKAGKKVKNRINYKSKHDYKNNFYSAAGEIPYAVFLTKKNDSDPKNPIRNMIPVPIHEVAQTYKEYHKFTPEAYLEKFRPEIKGYQNIKLLKVGQKVFVLKNDDEYDKIKSIEFQIDRMYKITQFSEGNIWLKYHLESRDVPTIKDSTKDIKSNIVYKIEERLGLPEIKEDLSTLDNKKRKKDFEDKMFKFSNLKDYRLNRLVEAIGEEETKKLKVRLDKYKAFSSSIELEGKTPLLKTSKNNWNFLFENYDFTIDITGKIEWIKE
jgi:CRISPR-associated endonuclease Csn1